MKPANVLILHFTIPISASPTLNKANALTTTNEAEISALDDWPNTPNDYATAPSLDSPASTLHDVTCVNCRDKMAGCIGDRRARGDDAIRAWRFCLRDTMLWQQKVCPCCFGFKC